MNGIANTEQAEHWSGKPGEVWVREQAMFDALMAPVLDLLLRQAGLRPGERVIDVGCGTGAGLLAAASAVGPEGHVTGVDVSTPMLSLAQERVAAAGHRHVECKLADAQVFDFADMGADHMLSRFGVMFFADPVAAFRNMKAGLKPGRRFTFVVWAGMDENPWFRLPAEVAKSVVGAPPPRDPRAPGPMAFSDMDYVRNILAGAGYGDVSVATEPVTLTPLGDLAQNAAFASREGPAGRIIKEMDGGRDAFETVADRLRVAFAPFEAPDGGVRIPGRVHVVSATSAG